MNTLDKLVGWCGGILGIVITFLPTISTEYKIIILLATALVCMSALYLNQVSKYKKVKNSLQDRVQKHKALAQQYAGKQDGIRQYKKAFNDLSMLFSVAVLNTSETKISQLHNAFLNIQGQIDDGGEEYARDL